MSTTKQILRKLAEYIELNACVLGALEKALLANAASGQPLTNRQLNKAKQDAKEEMKATFDALEVLIDSLPKD